MEKFCVQATRLDAAWLMVRAGAMARARTYARCFCAKKFIAKSCVCRISGNLV